MSVPPYDPGHFGGLSQSPMGGDLWRFLNEPSTVVRLETATALERPAVEGIEEQLLERFGEPVTDNRVKQMIGHMTRQVLERHGYVVDQQDVKITHGAPFTRGTRYVRRDEKIFHVFRKPDAPRELLLSFSKSPDLSGGNWSFWKSIKGELRACVALNLPNIRAAAEKMLADGRYLHTLQRSLRRGD